MSATCQCDETGDNPKCFAHGDGSQWALMQQVNDLLRERNALIAENEALKEAMAHDVECLGEAIANLSLYTSWRPSDPGTKALLASVEWMKGYPVPELVRALTAAMVRLEEAEKKEKSHGL